MAPCQLFDFLIRALKICKFHNHFHHSAEFYSISSWLHFTADIAASGAHPVYFVGIKVWPKKCLWKQVSLIFFKIFPSSQNLENLIKTENISFFQITTAMELMQDIYVAHVFVHLETNLNWCHIKETNTKNNLKLCLPIKKG